MEFKPVNIYGNGSIISQYDLEEIFFIQYNDLFNKLLSENINDFFSLLKTQVLFHLKIIDKRCDISLLSFFYEKYYEICQKDKFKIQNIYEKIINYPNQNYIELNILDIFVHCHKCKEAIHKCGNKLIIYNDLLFCLKCQKVYNQEHIKLFCKECNKTYLTTKRSISEKKHDFFYAVSYVNYHCYIENEEKIKCLNCGDDLYYNITKINEEENEIRDIYCIKCKLIFDTKKIFFNCKICGQNFKCEPQIYRNFSSIKKYLLLLVHTFRKGIYAIPNAITNKKCNCDINGVLYFLHHDNGILYQGKKNGKSVVICDCCYGIFKPDNFNWNCPYCGDNFQSIQIYDNTMSNSRKVIRKVRKIYTPNSNINIYNNNFNKERKHINNNIFYDYLGFPIENGSKQLIQSTSFVHNRGLSLNNQKRCLYLDDYNNKNYDNYKSSNRIVFKSGDYKRKLNNFKVNYSCDRILKNDNNNRINLKFKNNKLKKKYINKQSITYSSLNYSKNSNLYDNKPYNNINNISLSKNYIKKKESPSDQRMIIKGSKSVNNIKAIEPKNNNNNKKLCKRENEEQTENNRYKNKNTHNNNYIYTSINNKFIEMNSSSQKNENISPKKNNTIKIKDNNNISKSNNDIYKKKRIIEQKEKNKKNKKENLNRNTPLQIEDHKKENNKENIVANKNKVKNESHNNIKIIKSSNNKNKINKETKNIDKNKNEKTIFKNGNKKTEQKIDEIKKHPEIKNNDNNKNQSLNNNKENKLNNNNIFGDKKKEPKNSNLSRNNIINNEIILNDKSEINNNNVVHISVNNSGNKKLKNKKKLIKKKHKELRNNIPINKSMKKYIDEEDSINKYQNNSIIKRENSPADNDKYNTKVPIDSKNNTNKLIKENHTNNNYVHKKNNLSVNNMNKISGKEINDYNNNIINNKEIKDYNSKVKDYTKKNDYNMNKKDDNEIKNNIDMNIKNKSEINNNINMNIKDNTEIIKKTNNTEKNDNNNNEAKDYNLKSKTYINNINNKSIILNGENNKNNNNINENINNENNEIIHKNSNNILINNKNNIINNNNEQNNNQNSNITINNLNSSNNFENKINNNLNVIFNNKLNVIPNKSLSKSTNFNNIIHNNNDFNLKRNINNNNNNNINKNNIVEDSIHNNLNNNIIYNNNLHNHNYNNSYNINKIDSNDINKILINDKNKKKNNINNEDIINNSPKDSNKMHNIENNNFNGNINNSKIINKKVNTNDIICDNVKLNAILNNEIINNNSNNNIFDNDNLNKNETNKKFVLYHNLSKSTNNNLVNIPNKNLNNDLNKSINLNNNLNDDEINNNIIKNNIKNINNNKLQKNDTNINPNIIYDKDPKDTIRNSNINNNLNINTIKDNNNISIIDKNPEDNKKQNSNNDKIINNFNHENNLKMSLRYKKANNKIVDSNVLKLKLYFSSMEKIKKDNIKRKSSFDCRQSNNHFKLINNKDHIEIKTFDSNYYKIIRQIGKGTYGEIYLVQDPKTLHLFALKKIIISDALELRDNQEEYKLTWKLTHGNPELKIAKKYAIEIKKLDKYNLVMYILMEAANCDWEQELLNRQKVSAFYTEEELISILKSLVNTFAILQKKGISHRDVKPQNILCFGNDGYKLSDFGEAKTKNHQIGTKNIYSFEQNTIKQTVRGTELYMSPILFRALQTKIIESTEYNAYKSDVFSLGMCFLLASSLDYHSLFEIREVFDMKIIEGVINKYLGKLYSKNYIDLLISMLQIDEKLRPDFIELSSAFL